jgi:hypothetical protein
MGRAFGFLVRLGFGLASMIRRLLILSLPIVIRVLLIALTTILASLFAWWRGVPSTVRTIADYWSRNGSESPFHFILVAAAFVFIAISWIAQAFIITFLTLKILEMLLS